MKSSVSWQLWLLATAVISLLALSPSQIIFAQEISPKGQSGCTAGTVVGGPNLVFNGDFAIGAGTGPGIDSSAGFTSELPNRGPNVYPADASGGGFSIQSGPNEKVYQGGIVVGRPFPGDTQREVPPTETYFYSNPNLAVDGQTPLYGADGKRPVLLWRPTAALTVAPGTTYNFFAYFDNLLPEGAAGVDPVIELRVNGTAAGPPVVVPKNPDRWIPIQFSFTTGLQTSAVTLEVFSLTGTTFGDDFGMTQLSLKQCVSGLGVAKDARAAIDNGDGTFSIEYLIILRNYGSDPLGLAELQVSDDLVPVFASAGGFGVTSLQSTDLTVNAGFNGRSDVDLLSGSNRLAANQQATITLVVRVTPGTGSQGKGPFNNSVVARAKSGPIVVSDVSTPGTSPDPNGDGDPKDPNEDLPTPISLEPPKIYLPLLRR